MDKRLKAAWKDKQKSQQTGKKVPVASTKEYPVINLGILNYGDIVTIQYGYNGYVRVLINGVEGYQAWNQ